MKSVPDVCGRCLLFACRHLLAQLGDGIGSILIGRDVEVGSLGNDLRHIVGITLLWGSLCFYCGCSCCGCFFSLLLSLALTATLLGSRLLGRSFGYRQVAEE